MGDCVKVLCMFSSYLFISEKVQQGTQSHSVFHVGGKTIITPKQPVTVKPTVPLAAR